MNSVLLVGDTSDELYHVGDEASFNEVERRIGLAFARARRIACDWPIPSAAESLDALNRLRVREDVPDGLQQLLDPHDCVWFVGAGNLTSLFPAYLYQRLTLARASWLLGKTVVATSQTIGPFSQYDRELFANHAPMFAYWSVRDREWSGRELTAAGAVWDHTPDDAFDLPHNKIGVGEGFNIGLSLRDWDSSAANNMVRRILSECELDFRVHLIPHIVAESNRFDIAAMRAAFPGVSYGFEFFRANTERVDIGVKSLTAAMDLVIATRYHGAVFAVTAPTRCIALYEGEYYQRKMEGLGSWNFPHLLVNPIASSPTPDEVRALLTVRPRPHSLDLIGPSEIVQRARMRGHR